MCLLYFGYFVLEILVQEVQPVYLSKSKSVLITIFSILPESYKVVSERRVVKRSTAGPQARSNFVLIPEDTSQEKM